MKKILIINFKNYQEIYGDRTLELAKVAEKIAHSTDSDIVIAPPQPSLALVGKNLTIKLICQHIDASASGATTGFFTAEAAKSYGASGSLINHSEHRVNLTQIRDLVLILKKLQMTSIVCAQTPEEVENIAQTRPDYIAIEPPQLIGSGKAVSKEDPAIITNSISSLMKQSSESKLICGAGIIDASDVSAAIGLGAEGVLVASGIVKAQSWEDKIREIVNAL